MKKLLLTAFAFWSSAALAEDQISPSPFIEALPDDIERRIAADSVRSIFDAGLQNGNVSEQFIQRSNMWSLGDTLRVCFFGGTQGLRARIAKVALSWTQPGAPVKLDFGNLNDPRICGSGSGISHIRIGYSYRGYWSLVGRDSLVYADQYQQSMNLQRFDSTPPSSPEFERIVLHEFGHALGFQHEHQNPLSSCEEEFNWDIIYRELRGAPNFWDDDKINHNLRRMPYYSGDFASTFDRTSIMLYTFPEYYYRMGIASKCYSPANDVISAGDRAALSAAYSQRPASINALTEFAKALPPQDRSAAFDRIEFWKLQSDAALVVSEGRKDIEKPLFASTIKKLPKTAIDQNALDNFYTERNK